MSDNTEWHGEDYAEFLPHNDPDFDDRLAAFFHEVYTRAHENGSAISTEPNSEDDIAHPQAIAIQQYYQKQLLVSRLPYHELLVAFYEAHAQGVFSLPDTHYRLITETAELLERHNHPSQPPQDAKCVCHLQDRLSQYPLCNAFQKFPYWNSTKCTCLHQQACHRIAS